MANNNLHLVVVPPAIDELSDAEPPEITHAAMVKSGNVLIVQAYASSSSMDEMEMLDKAYAKLKPGEVTDSINSHTPQRNKSSKT